MIIIFQSNNNNLVYSNQIASYSLLFKTREFVKIRFYTGICSVVIKILSKNAKIALLHSYNFTHLVIKRYRPGLSSIVEEKLVD